MRGRPVLYKGMVARCIVSLVRKTNAVRAMAILHAGPRNVLREQRNLKVIPSALKISMPTILNLARKAGLELKVGRPSKAA